LVNPSIPKMATSGSPGRMRRIAKTNTETAKIVTNPKARRRTI